LDPGDPLDARLQRPCRDRLARFESRSTDVRSPGSHPEQAPSWSRIHQDSSSIREVGRHSKDCDLMPMTPCIGSMNEALAPRPMQGLTPKTNARNQDLPAVLTRA
jgi:hypothetical protein